MPKPKLLNKYTTETVRAKNPTITISRVEKISGELGKKDLNVTVSEYSPLSRGQRLSASGWVEHGSLKQAIKKAKNKVFVKTATFGGKARFYSD